MTDTELQTVREEEAVKKTEPRKKKKKIKAPYVVVFALVLVVCIAVFAYQMTNSVSTTITLHSSSIETGTNPDGTPFSIMEIFNDAVMDKVVQKLNGQMTAEEIRSHLTISDASTSVSYANLEQSIRDGEYGNVYFPNTYVITYSTISEQIKEKGFFATCQTFVDSFTGPSKKIILRSVVESYQDYYAETYLDYKSLLEIDWNAVDSMDYYNRAEFMKDTVQKLTRFLSYKNNQSKTDIVANGVSYEDLRAIFSNRVMTDIESYQSYVIQHGVTKNKAELLRQFARMEQVCEEENLRQMQEYSSLCIAIAMYDTSTTGILYIPSLSQNDSFYMNKTKVGMDYLVERASTAKLAADQAAIDMEYYDYLQTSFCQDCIVDENGCKKQVKNTVAQRDYIDNVYKTLKNEIQRLVGDVTLVLEEGNKTEIEDVRLGEIAPAVGIVGAGMGFAKRFVLLSMAAFLVCYVVVGVSKVKAQKKAQKKAQEDEEVQG